MTGNLPWADLKDKKEIYESKLDRHRLRNMCSELPHEIFELYRCIDQWSYEAQPDYKLLESFLVKAMNKQHPQIPFDLPFEWENLPERHIANLNPLIKLEYGREPDIMPTGLVSPVVPGDEKYAVKTEGGCCLVQ
jgi:hypothetical protein